MNAVEIEAALSDLSVEPFDAQEFPYHFLAAFGNKEVALKRLRTGVNGFQFPFKSGVGNLADGFTG